MSKHSSASSVSEDQRTILYVTTERRYEMVADDVYLSGAEDAAFFERYLEVYDKVVVVARCRKSAKRSEKKRFDSSDRIELRLLEVGPLRQAHLFEIYKCIREIYRTRATLVVRTPGIFACMVSLVADVAKVSYALEVVSDPEEEAKFSTSSRVLRTALVPLLVKIFTRQLSRCVAASFVTQQQIQNKFLSTESRKSEKYSFSYSSLRLGPHAFVERVMDAKEFGSRINHLVFVGELERPFKGLDLLIRAVALLDDRSVSVCVLGGGRLLDDLKLLAQSCDVDSQFRFVGYVADESEKLSLYRKAGVLVLPSRREGLPRVVIEAMASGLACVASDVSGVRELLDDEFIFPVNDYQALAGKLRWLIGNPEIAFKAATRNRESASRFSDPVLQAKRCAFYSYILSHK